MGVEDRVKTEVAPGVTKADFERAFPEDPSNAPGWDQHVEDFFDRDVFPGESVRKATDAMQPSEGKPEDGAAGVRTPLPGVDSAEHPEVKPPQRPDPKWGS